MRNTWLLIISICIAAPFARAQTSIDPTLYYTDTILAMDADHSIAITKKKFAPKNLHLDQEELDYQFITLQWLKQGKVIYKTDPIQENFFNRFYSLDTGKEKKYYVSLMSFGGGSGYMSAIYQVYPDEPGKLDTIAYYNELDWCIFNNTGTEMLILKGIWDMGENSSEGHFGEHIYKIYKIDLLQQKPAAIYIVSTRYKYQSIGVDISAADLIKMIKTKEPAIFKKISLEGYMIK